MFSGCPGDFVVDDADVECGDHVALTAGFPTPTVAALLSLLGVSTMVDMPLMVSLPVSVFLEWLNPLGQNPG